MEKEREIILPPNRLQKTTRGSQLMGSFNHVKISPYIEQSIDRSRKNLGHLSTKTSSQSGSNGSLERSLCFLAFACKLKQQIATRPDAKTTAGLASQLLYGVNSQIIDGCLYFHWSVAFHFAGESPDGQRPLSHHGPAAETSKGGSYIIGGRERSMRRSTEHPNAL